MALKKKAEKEKTARGEAGAEREDEVRETSVELKTRWQGPPPDEPKPPKRLTAADRHFPRPAVKPARKTAASERMKFNAPK